MWGGRTVISNLTAAEYSLVAAHGILIIRNIDHLYHLLQLEQQGKKNPSYLYIFEDGGRSPTSTNITPLRDIKVITHSTLFLSVCLTLMLSASVLLNLLERFHTLIFIFTIQHPIIPLCVKAGIYLRYPEYTVSFCVYLTVIWTLSSVCREPLLIR